MTPEQMIEALQALGHVVTPPPKKERRECWARYFNDDSLRNPWGSAWAKPEKSPPADAEVETVHMREVWPGDVTLSAQEYADLKAKAEPPEPKFKAGDRVRIKDGFNAGQIVEVVATQLCSVRLNSDPVLYSEHRLELVEAAP